MCFQRVEVFLKQSVMMSSVCTFFCGCGSEGNFDFLWGFLTGPYFRISSSSFCSMRGCGWNLPEAQRYAEKTVRFTGRFSVIQHTCYSKVITDARWGLMRNGLVHTATEGQTHRGPLGAYWACAARQEAGVGLLSMACVCSHHSSHAMAHSAFRKRFGGGDAALTVCSEAGTPHWSVFVCCVIRESEVLKRVKPSPSSTEQVVSRLCWNLCPLLPLRPESDQGRPVRSPHQQHHPTKTITAEACSSCRIENRINSEMALKYPNNIQRWIKVCHLRSSFQKINLRACSYITDNCVFPFCSNNLWKAPCARSQVYKVVFPGWCDLNPIEHFWNWIRLYSSTSLASLSNALEAGSKSSQPGSKILQQALRQHVL